jgi:2-polyprenyl-3-methyl-5-hydroxy-6-metoxy-1,4-benzoquinol methylase
MVPGRENCQNRGYRVFEMCAMAQPVSRMNPVPPSYIIADQEKMSLAKNYFAWQWRLINTELGPRVVEVGCGIGNFTRMLHDRELVIAIDSEPECVDRLKERLRNQANLQAMALDLMHPQFADLTHFRPDSCVCLNVLEHIEDDCEALRKMASILVPQGVIVLLLPEFPSLYGPIDRRLGHHRRYSRASLLALTKAAGLRLQKLRYLNAAGFFGWWVNAHVLKRESQSEVQIEFFDRFVVPLMSRVESCIRPPFGQSLFAVLKKQ